MAKAKGKKGSPGGAQSHIRARLDYLHNAAIYLQSTAVASRQSSSQLAQNTTSPDGEPVSASALSLKTQLRLPVETKRSYCKRCDTLLSPGVSCIQEIRNESRDRKKPWADVRVILCTTCETEKRFPQTERRTKKLSERRKQSEQEKLQAPAP
ncbi:RNAse P Rpr2/Rpp21 subunit domain protein [Aspergillus flavus AF70]|nr:RNAse P Rpr2/Rpp21 subunit domain protein [Aspergillus flavus AF70]